MVEPCIAKKMKTQNQNTITCTVPISDDILENIFSFLPLKCAAQMSILSRRFKNSLLSNRNLDFGIDFARGFSKEDYISEAQWIINQSEYPKVRRLMLFLDPTGELSRINGWIHQAVSKGVEELDLDFSKAKRSFQVPDCIFYCQTLGSLTLSSCYLVNFPFIPQSYDNLRNLTSLSLRKVALAGELVQAVLSHCLLLENLELRECSVPYLWEISAPRLQRLILVDCKCRDAISVDAPNLSSIQLCSCFLEFKCVSSVSKLADVFLKFKKINRWKYRPCVVKLLQDLSDVHVLTLSSTFLELLVPKHTDKGFNWTKLCWNNVKEFQLLMELGSFVNPLGIMAFLKRCPYLESLFVDLRESSFACGTYWELLEHDELERFRYSLGHLKYVKMTGFKLCNIQLLLVKFFLKKVVSLKKMVLILHKNQKSKILAADILRDDKILKLQQGSPSVDIDVYDYSTDGSCLHPTHDCFLH